VTGASSGIGATYADRLAQRGYDIILVARSRRRLEDLGARLSDRGTTVEVVVADLIDRKGVRHVKEIGRKPSPHT
jgi:hypothetical protein